MTPQFLRVGFVLGLLSAIGTFAIGVYLLALPKIGADLNARTTAVQMKLLVFFLAIGMTQIVVGQIANTIGCKAQLLL